MKIVPRASAPAIWTIDPLHTAVAFSVRHLLITNVRGVFGRVTGSVQYEAEAPAASVICLEIPVDSIDTRAPQRDAHLRSSDFFDAQRYPLIRFESTRVRATGEGSLEVTGELTMHGVTREVILAVTELAGIVADHNGQPRMGGTARAKLKRSDFGMTFNKVLDTGLAIADEVLIEIDFSLQKSTAPATG